ncbi:MAG: OmpA family protein [Planctomycetia bacterium]
MNGPAAMHAAMGQLAVPGVETRFDGNVVRLEVPAERLFDGGSATLLPGGTAILTQVAGEIDRVFPRHFVGIEGHVDTEPLSQTSWGSPHQLTSARATTVFDFFTTRTPLRQGQLFLVAHGANHPVVSNATAAGRIRNRRMEFVSTPSGSAASSFTKNTTSCLEEAPGGSRGTRAIVSVSNQQGGSPCRGLAWVP